MMSLSREQIQQLYNQRRSRGYGSYIKSLLAFQIGREPTAQEVAEYEALLDREAQARRAAEAAQPWHLRKHRFSTSSRIERILTKRYGVPQFLVDQLINEVSEGW